MICLLKTFLYEQEVAAVAVAEVSTLISYRNL